VIQNAVNTYAGCKVIFFDHGHYIVTNTITFPPGTRLVGEAWSVIYGKGSKFQNQDSPLPVFKGAFSSTSFFRPCLTAVRHSRCQRLVWLL
jgi:hypothetical protein